MFNVLIFTLLIIFNCCIAMFELFLCFLLLELLYCYALRKFVMLELIFLMIYVF